MKTNGTANGTNGHDDDPIRVNISPWPEPIGNAGMYGIAGDFVRLVGPHTEADPNAILLSFLVYAGNLMGRDYYIPTGADRHAGNLYLCLVGPTAGGRKGSAIAAAEQFFTRGQDAPGMPRILYGISSGEGVIWKVHDAVSRREWNKRTKIFEDMPMEENIEEKRTLYSLSEFQQTITNMRRPDSVLSSVLRQAWDKDRIASPSKNSSASATGAHISMISGISKEELLLETTSVDAQNGTLNRFLFACVRRSKLLPEGETFELLVQKPEWGDLQIRLKENIRNTEGEILSVRRQADAQTFWGLNASPQDGGLYKRLSELRPGLWGTITARAPQQVMRLSLITAIINGRRRITPEDQDAAWEYWRFCDDSCKFIWGDKTDLTAAKILLWLREAGPEGMTRTEISDKFAGHQAKEDINYGLNWLAERGMIFSQLQATGGRPVQRWWATL